MCPHLAAFGPPMCKGSVPEKARRLAKRAKIVRIAQIVVKNKEKWVHKQMGTHIPYDFACVNDLDDDEPN